jgi:hypothetical protein
MVLMDVTNSKTHLHYARTFLKWFWFFIVLAAIDFWDIAAIFWCYPEEWHRRAFVPLLVLGVLIAVFVVYKELIKERNQYLDEKVSSRDVLREDLREVDRMASHIGDDTVFSNCGQILMQSRRYGLFREPKYANVLNLMITAEQNGHPWQRDGQCQSPGGIFLAFIFGMKSQTTQRLTYDEHHTQQGYGISELRKILDDKIKELDRLLGD